MSAKTRLAIWVTSMVLIISAMVLTFVLVLNRQTLPEDPKRYLINVVMDNFNDVEFDNGRLEWDDLSVYKRGVYCSYYDEEGNLLLSANEEGMDFSDLEFEDNVTRIATVNDIEYFVYDKYVDMDVAGIWIRGVTRTDSHYGIMDTIIHLTLIVLPLILIITFLGAYFISTRTFLPMEKIIATANSINDADDLTDRINLKRGTKEMKKLSRAFDRMFERLEKLFDSERQFTSDASHELRTPTAIILAECDRAKRKDLSKEQYAETIDSIQEQGQRMNQLIDELLGITRLQQGTERFPLHKGDLSEFVSLCAEDFAVQDDRGISLDVDIEEGIEAPFNASLMSRVIYNYLQNAYKYGRDNGHVKLTLKKEVYEKGIDKESKENINDKKEKKDKKDRKDKEKAENCVVLAVSDDGIGISDENKEKIWNRFWQVDTSRGVEGGSGLGLSMVKGIADLHKGKVDVESTEGEGSTFYFILPAE